CAVTSADVSPPRQARIIPSSLAKTKAAGPPLTMKFIGMPAKIAPVGPPSTPTTSGLIEIVVPLLMYSVDLSIPLSATHHRLVAVRASPQPLTRFGSGSVAAPGTAETRFVTVYEPSGGAADSGAAAASVNVETAATSARRKSDLRMISPPLVSRPKRSIRAAGLSGLPGVETPVVIAVVGAGPAGLACAAQLQRSGQEVVVLERGEVGAAWATRYDRLRLHTVRWLSSLPGYRMPRALGKWPARDSVIDYLQRYAAVTGVSVRTGVEVEEIVQVDGHWRLHTSAGDVDADRVVVATGHSNQPYLPDWPGSFTGELLHSADYRNSRPYAGRSV